MARRLTTIAKHINDTWPGYTATVKKVTVSTDRKIPGSRLIWPGKGRTGNRLTVTEDATGRVVLKHDAAETYTSNDQVEDWVERVENGRGSMVDRIKYLPGREAKRIAWLQQRIDNECHKLTTHDDWRPDQIESIKGSIKQYEREIVELRGGSEEG